MRQQIETHHQLMMRETWDEEWTSWHMPVIASMYEPAERLAQDGRLVESLEAARKAWIALYGDTSGVQFRIETTTKFITTLEQQESEHEFRE